MDMHFNVKKTQCIMFHHKQCVDTNTELTLNGDILTWSHITHLGHHCCLSFRNDINIRKGCFIQCVNEICTEFAFAHPKCQAKLLQVFGTSFYGSNLWDLYSKQFMSLGKTWNVAIRKVYNVPFQTYCRFLHVSQLNHVTHMLKSRFIKFMVANLIGKNNHVTYVANLCFRNAISSSGRNINMKLQQY